MSSEERGRHSTPRAVHVEGVCFSPPSSSGLWVLVFLNHFILTLWFKLKVGSRDKGDEVGGEDSLRSLFGFSRARVQLKTSVY